MSNGKNKMSTENGKEISEERAAFIRDNGAQECICDGAGNCPVFQQYMSPNLQRWCKKSQNYRSKFLGMDNEAGYSKQTQELMELKKLASNFDDATRELEKEGVSLDGASEGLGDTVEKVLGKFGITKKIMAKISGQKDCRCNKRREWLNKVFKYTRKEDD